MNYITIDVFTGDQQWQQQEATIVVVAGIGKQQ